MFSTLQGLALSAGIFAQSLSAEPTAEARLLLPEQIVAGTKVEVALELTPAETLHVYHINPGEMGQAVSLTWNELPAGFTAGELRFPLPHRMKTGELPTNGYEETTLFFSELTIASEVAPGEYSLQATASWLACNDSKCVVGKKEFSANLVVGAEEAISGSDAARLDKALALIPIDASADWSAHVQKEGSKWVIELKAPSGSTPLQQVTDVFSETSDFFEPGALPEITQAENGLRISVAASEYGQDLDSAKIVLAGPTPPLRIKLNLPEKK